MIKPGECEFSIENAVKETAAKIEQALITFGEEDGREIVLREVLSNHPKWAIMYLRGCWYYDLLHSVQFVRATGDKQIMSKEAYIAKVKQQLYKQRAEKNPFEEAVQLPEEELTLNEEE